MSIMWEYLLKNAQEWLVPIDKIGRIKTKEVKSVQKINFFDRATQRNILIEDGVKNNCAYVTYKDGCYEFLIGIHFSKKRIYYTRVDLLDYHYAFIIDDWFCNQSIEQIVNKVTDDFVLRLRSNELEWVYSILYGQSCN